MRQDLDRNPDSELWGKVEFPRIEAEPNQGLGDNRGNMSGVRLRSRPTATRPTGQYGNAPRSNWSGQWRCSWQA